MKKQTLVSAAVAATMMPLFGLSGFASAAGITTITLSTGLSNRECSIYDSSGSTSLPSCKDDNWDGHGAPASNNSYTPGTNTLVLDTAINSMVVSGFPHIQIDGNGPITIKSYGDIRGIGFVSENADLTFDFGYYSYYGISEKVAYARYGKTMTVKSGNIFLPLINSLPTLEQITINGGTTTIGDPTDDEYWPKVPGNITLNNGTLNLISTTLLGGEVDKNLTVNGGQLNALTIYAQNITINDGNIASTGNRASFFLNANEITINGGTINATNAVDGVKGLGAGNVKISGGNITLDGFSVGINSTNKASFDGGTTTIKNSEKAVVAKEIAFGDGIGIKENGTQVKNEGETSYIDANLVTIAKVESDPEGGDPESKPGDTEGGDEQPVPEAGGEAPKTPDTGAFSASSSAVLIALSVVLVAILSGAGYLGVYSFNRHNRKVKFNK